MVVDGILYFDDKFAYIQQFHPGYAGLVGTEDTGSEHLSQTRAEVSGGLLDGALVAVLEVDVDEMTERRITESTPFGRQLAIERSVIIINNLVDDGQVGVLGLKDDKAALALAPCPAADLTDHIERMLVSPENRGPRRH